MSLLKASITKGMKAALLKSEIDGHRIQRVLQTPFVDIEGITVCQLFVEIDGGTVFELVSCDELEGKGLQRHALKSKLIPAQFPKGSPSADGDNIITLVTSDLLPSIGVQLSSNRILSMRASGRNYVGPFISDIAPYFVGELYSYWNKEQIQLS